MPRDRRGGLDGILVIAKPPGPTSHDVVALVRRLSGTKRVGHGGTLDPFAAGVLPVFLGGATRLVEFHLGAPKRYRATICFGATSTTDDIDGERTPVEGPPVTREAVEAGLAAMLGPISQVPPQYSAIQVEGRRAYQMARAGQNPELAPRAVTLHALDVLEWDDSDPERPFVVVDVRCSAGTYVRAIARDLGAALGSGAYLGALARTESGAFRMEDALTIEALRASAEGGPAGVAALLRPSDAGLDDIPVLVATPAEVVALARGVFIHPSAGMPAVSDGSPIRVHDEDGRIVALARRHRKELRPDKVLFDTAAVRGVKAKEPMAPVDGDGSEPATAPEVPGEASA
jgi:tRNA pseudouridine55 synthase